MRDPGNFLTRREGREGWREKEEKGGSFCFFFCFFGERRKKMTLLHSRPLHKIFMSLFRLYIVDWLFLDYCVSVVFLFFFHFC